MSKWTLSDDTMSKLATICQNINEKLPFKNEEKDKEYKLLKLSWKAQSNHTSVSNTKNDEYLVPLLDGVWKQCWVQELADEDFSEEHDADKCTSQTSEPEILDHTQQDSFLAELSQMFK